LIVYLTGFMGSGKTTLGRKLAALLKYRFIDLDSEIEKREGRSVSSIFSDTGEKYFRRVESEVLRSIGGEGNLVIAAGGGTPCYGYNLDYMKSTGVTVYLKMSAGAIVSRLGVGISSRPLLKGLTGDDLLKYVEEKIREREPYYLKSAIVFDGLNAEASKLKDAIESAGYTLVSR
jgi:shikimate kinase